MQDSESQAYKLQALDRTFALLDALARSNEPQSLAEIAASLKLHKSTAHRFLMVLERHRIIERSSRGRFRLGLRLFDYGSRALEQHDLREIAAPHLRKLVDEVGETAHLSILDHDHIVYLDKIEPARSIRMISRIGSTSPAYCTASGRSMLATLAPELREKQLKRIKVERFTEKTKVTLEDLMKELERTRRRGYGIDDGEREDGVRCLGVAIFAPDGVSRSAISVSGPPFRITKQKLPAIVSSLQLCARAIERDMGYSQREL
ncbi:IclR family transcriptional regulator [Acidipila rosea]|uniref:IclR family transcriptional regulator n=1 Tax=Acidipila rosea TaxID=768535 RepID=A0A4R1L6Q1_9BACT|nr:IclR family transcriptional regulator [Acidipila rosea]MBW4026322.1 IclR family transcriptional regulator [Acidobacteriota bacterium]MBW4044542.1 IclR family transcriptional regulator [Acidobacteriota bacterium]TCK72713.1 IclR family transcriptional regulator [Acidipila rosea]